MGKEIAIVENGGLPMYGIVLLALLIILLGITITLISFRLSGLNKVVEQIESRVARLEILNELRGAKKEATVGTKK